MASSEIRATITLDASQFNSNLNGVVKGLDNFASSANDIGSSTSRSFAQLGKDLGNVGLQMQIAGQSIQTFFKPVAGILTDSIKSAVSYEDAFAGVRKTVDATEPEFNQLSDAIRNMSKQMPESADEIAHVMEIAGQLGISGVDNLETFTKTAVMLGDTTNLSSEEASTALAKFLNITGSGTDTVDRLGSTLVDLGNNTATTEADIMNMALGLAAAGSQVGMTDSDILGFAATLSSLGIASERGGTAFSKLMINMEVATETGGEALEQFASVAGMSADQFKEKFKTDATGAITDFIGGLKNINDNGGSAIKTLDDMGIKEVRLRDTIMRAVEGYDMMNDNLKLSTDAYNDNNALVEEAGKRYETTQSKIDIFKNKLKDVGISIGNAVLPAISKLLDIGGKIIDWVGQLDPKFLAIVGVIGAVGVAIGGFISVLGLVVSGISGGISALGLLGGALSAISAPVLAVVAVIAGLVAAFVYCWNNVEGFREKVTEAFHTVCDVVSSVVSTIWDVIQTVWGAIKPFVIEVFQGCAEIIGEVFTIITDYVVPAVKNIWDTIEKVWGAIKPYVEKIFGGIAEYLGGIWEVIKSVIKAALDIIKAIMDGDWGAIKDIVLNMVDGIKNGIKRTWDGIKQIIDTVLDAIKAVISNIWEAIKNKISSVLDGIKSVVSSAWEAVKNKVSSVLDGIKAVISTAWEAVKNKISYVLDGIKSVVSSAWEGVKNKISSVLDGIKSVASNAWDNIKNKASSAFEGIKSTASNVWNGIKSAITHPIETAKDKVLGIVDRIKSAFSNMHISIPKPKLPHISVGSKSFLGGKVTIPTFSIDWYAKGGFFDGATMIGVGEAGKEAVLPLENKRNMKPYAEAVASLMNDLSNEPKGNVYNNFNISQLVVREEADIKKVAEELYTLQRREQRRRGVPNV